MDGFLFTHNGHAVTFNPQKCTVLSHYILAQLS